MGWIEHVVVDLPGLTPEQKDQLDLKGFVQSVDMPAALAWVERFYNLTRPEVEEQLNRGDWRDQKNGTLAALSAMSNFWKALNLRWMYDPEMLDRWRDTYGGKGFNPMGNFCDNPTGPVGFWGQPGIESAYGTGSSPAMTLANVQALWKAVKGPLPTEDRTVWDFQLLTPDQRAAVAEYRACYSQRQIYQGGSDAEGDAPPDPHPYACDDMPGRNIPVPSHVAHVDVFPTFRIVVPAFLDYDDVPFLVDGAIPKGGRTGDQNFDGLYVGVACPDANGNYREVPKDQAVWTWNCFKWDDAPLNPVRVLPPLRWSFQLLRAMADNLYNRNVWQIVKDVRMRAILTNVQRMIQYKMTEGDLDAGVANYLHWLNTAQHDGLKESAVFGSLETGCAVAGGIATAVNPVAGAAVGVGCAIVIAIGKLFALLPPAAYAHGCDTDVWGYPQPSAVVPYLEAETPKWTVKPPPGVNLLDRKYWVTDAGEPLHVTVPIQFIANKTDPTEITINRPPAGKKGKLTLKNPLDDTAPPGTQPGAKPLTKGGEGGGGGLVAGGIVAGILYLLFG